jgi:hypothetical protein
MNELRVMPRTSIAASSGVAVSSLVVFMWLSFL